MYQSGNKMLQIKYKHKKERSPESLFCLCLKYIACNLDVICKNTLTGYKLNPGYKLPSVLCDPFLKIYQNNGGQISDCFLHLFKDITTTKLTSVHIDSSNITDDGFTYLLRHNLENISIINCQNLSQVTYLNIFKQCVNLRSLTIRFNIQSTTFNELFNCSLTFDGSKIIHRPNPNLKHLVLSLIPDSPFIKNNIFLKSVFDNYLELRILDLSYCLDVGSLQDISKLQYLHTLILFDVPRLQNYYEAILNICTLTSLVVLDMSQTNWSPEAGFYKDGNKTLARIVKSLPNLMYLDISGTNLAGRGKFLDGTAENSPSQSSSDKKSDIPGLENRVDNPLEFLGLYNTMYNACRRHNIPAKIISGNADEIQLFNAAASCMNKPKLLYHILNDLFRLLENVECTRLDHALDLVLEVLTRNVRDRIIQINGSAILYSIIKEDPSLLNNITVKGNIINTLITGMEFNNYEETVIRNGCLTLYQLRISPVMILEFNRLIRLLLHILTFSVNEGFVQQITIHLLNIIVEQVNDKQRNEIGDAGITEKLMGIIHDRYRRRVFDNVLEVAWLAILNLTKGCPKNCKKFLDGHGAKYFIECLTIFPGKSHMMRFMMGSLGNVVEVKELRPMLMEDHIIKLFYDLLFSTQEVSFHAAGIIAYLASDGHEAWIIKKPERCEVLDHVTKCIQKWNLDELNINYRNIKSILELAQASHTPQCIYWAVWALANLTRVYPDTYCLIVIVENGLRVMRELLEEDDPISKNNGPGVVHSLAQTVIDQCMVYLNDE
ncbi:Armadillo-type fold,Leucine-rich repeat domain, L domain-like,Armadillo-like helical [Cinara cedri]|uniref:Armadillo-type fold,Leucine-rich repeat domain, L domain-like,Armadillo-like helical n=1 Tax=Cinara cedri TaxID=506608 RepID=A0A5E4N7R5_9HEMI|nr:Armadillo-type fold,Leucine-rich repeat domain, L domain-like,Armadillo-like helical [Cinara cedri]